MGSLSIFWLFANYDKKFQTQLMWMSVILMVTSVFVLFAFPTAAVIGYAGIASAHAALALLVWKIKIMPLVALFLGSVPLFLYAMYIKL